MRPFALLLLPLVAALVSGPLPAQTIVSPKHFTFAEGISGLTDGIGDTSRVSRLLQIHDDVNVARSFKKLSFRRDGLASGVYAAGNLVCSIFVSTAKRTAQSISSTFDANHGADKLQVARFQAFSLPKTAPRSVPHPFLYQFPFSSPFAFKGSASFCWEVQVQVRTNKQRLQLDSVFSWSPNPSLVVFSGGMGCKATGQRAPVLLTGTGLAAWPQNKITLTYKGSNLPPNSPVFLNLGGSDQNIGPFRLPFLLPGTSSAPSGPCVVMNDSVLALPVRTTATGTISTSLSTRATVRLHGGSVFAQIILLDRKANPLGIVLSNMVQHHVVAPFNTVGIGHVFLNGSLGPVGTARSFNGLIVRLE